jgi:hypothetical protein
MAKRCAGVLTAATFAHNEKRCKLDVLIKATHAY